MIAVFTPDDADAPGGSWAGIRIGDGEPCELPESPEGGHEEHADVSQDWPEECLRLPEPRAAGYAVSLAGGIYLLGGVVLDDNPRDPTNSRIRADTAVWYLDTGSFPLEWERMPDMNEAREHFTAVVVDDRIYALRGRTEDDVKMRSVESWAPDEEGWRMEQEAPIGGSAGIVAAIDACIYVFGGEFTPMTATGTLTVSQVFDTEGGSWQTLEVDIEEEPLDASLVLLLHGVFGVTLEHDGEQRIFAFGGGDEAWGSPISRIHVFTPPETCTE